MRPPRKPPTPDQLDRRRRAHREYQARRRARMAPLVNRIERTDRPYSVPPDDPVYSVAMVAVELQVSQPTIIRWVKGCKLPAELDPDFHYCGLQMKYMWPKTVVKRLKEYLNAPRKGSKASGAGVPRLPKLETTP